MAHKALAVYDYNDHKLCDLYDSYLSHKGQAFEITTVKE